MAQGVLDELVELIHMLRLHTANNREAEWVSGQRAMQGPRGSRWDVLSMLHAARGAAPGLTTHHRDEPGGVDEDAERGAVACAVGRRGGGHKVAGQRWEGQKERKNERAAMGGSAQGSPPDIIQLPRWPPHTAFSS